MRFFEITKDSPAYETVEKLWNKNKVWRAAAPEIEALIQCQVINNLRHVPGRLSLDHVPQHLEAFFNKRQSLPYRQAKVKSDINKKFREISQKYGLYHASPFDVANILDTVLQSGKETYHPPIDGRYYFQTEREIGNSAGLVELSEPEFLRMRADWLERSKRDDFFR
jgi:hypothetical protein